MDEGKFVADFISANLEKIYSFWKKIYGKTDAAIQIKLKTAYTDYLNASRLKHSKSKSFFIRNQPVELYSYYVPTGISCGDKVISKPNFKKCIEFTNRIVISGTGGSGKSVLMKHLFLDCIQGKTHTPILIELRDLNNYEKNVDDFINETLSNFGFNISNEYIKNAKDAGHFCYLFDGFDEIPPKLRNKILKQISALSKKFPQCPVFISSRPDDILTGIDDFSTFSMLPLRLNEALELVEKLPFDEIIKRKFCESLSSCLFAEHKSFLSNPLLLSIMLLTYGENAEIPSKLSIFYNQAYEALFRRHDAYKGAYNRDRQTSLDILDFSRLFSLFCVQTYEKRLFKMPRSVCLEFIQKCKKVLEIEVDPNDYLSDLLSAACLLIEDGLEITFSHRSFQEYFVALYISSASDENQIKLIDRFWVNMNYDSVMQLLKEINSDVFERSLLVPKLESFFKQDLKVKRKVGISHLVNYYKILFSTIEWNHHEHDGVIFIFKDANSNTLSSINTLLKIAAIDYSKFVINLEAEGPLLFEKYFQTGMVYKTSLLSIRSPIVLTLNKNGTWHSVSYLAAAYAAYTKLKSKHANTSESFDILLGLK